MNAKYQALDFIREQGWKTDEVVLVGHSAGAHLAALSLDGAKSYSKRTHWTPFARTYGTMNAKSDLSHHCQ
jgi:acetyl esterase/lipase